MHTHSCIYYRPVGNRKASGITSIWKKNLICPDGGKGCFSLTDRAENNIISLIFQIVVEEEDMKLGIRIISLLLCAAMLPGMMP